MQDNLFEASPSLSSTSACIALAPAARRWVGAAAKLPSLLRMGVSTWSYPGWKGLVWEHAYDARVLAKQGLVAYGQHPLMRTVSVDKTFWRPLDAMQYAQMAAQVPEDFRFMLKCPNSVTDALVRGKDGQGQLANPAFLQPELAIQQFVLPALQGMGQYLGVLVFQISPLPQSWLRQPSVLLAQLDALLGAVRSALQTHAGSKQDNMPIVALEVRDAQWLTPELVHILRTHQATYCLGLHGKMPAIEAQLPILRALWPGPLVCRWSLNRSFGPFGYAAAQEKHAPFSDIRSPDPHTRSVLARTMAGIIKAGQPAFVSVSNDAEGCAPRSISLLAREVLNNLSGQRSES